MTRSASATSQPATPAASLAALPTARLLVRYEARDAVFLPKSPAGIWRGQLGAALYRAAQSRSGAEGRSTYEQLFRTPRSAVCVPDRPARILGPVGLAGDHVPHPFVLRVETSSHRRAPVHLAPGDTTTWTIGLVGTALGHVPALTAALDGLAQEGLGRKTPQPSGPARQGRLRLCSVTLRVGRLSFALYDGATWRLPSACDPSLFDRAEALLEPAPPKPRSAPDGPVEVTLETPVHLVHDETTLSEPESLTAAALAHACYRRWAALALCYAPEPPSADRLDAAFEQARALGRRTKISNRDLTAVERFRYSTRQEQLLSQTGLQGTLRLNGSPDHLAQWRRWIERVGPVHIGKSTAMGFGRITVN